MTSPPVCSVCKNTGRSKPKNWLVYIVQCSDGTLYTGVTNNLVKRIIAHNKGKGAKYTRARLPVELLCWVNGLTKSEAMKLEYKVKKQPRSRKMAFLQARRVANYLCSDEPH